MPSPEFLAIRDQMIASPIEFPDDLAEARIRFDEMLGATPLADGVSVSSSTLGGRDVEWLTPPGPSTNQVVFYLHGGGYRIGSIAAYRSILSNFAVALGRRIVAVEYRLAPEHPFPAGLDDAVAAYEALLESGTDPTTVAVMGDSAGGGLAAALVLALVERDAPQPGAVVSLSPFADLTLGADSYRRNAGTDPQWSWAQAQVAAADYVGDASATDPLVSPVFGNFSTTAPLLIHAADVEALADDAVHLAAAAHRSGGQARCELWPGLSHVWHAMYPHVPEAREALHGMRDFLDNRLR